MLLKGVVKKGTGKGRRRGVPTANIIIEERHYNFLREGVYAAWTKLDGKTYKSAFSAQIEKRKIQVHLIDYTGDDFYEKEIEIDLYQQISQMEDFNDEEELAQKIQRDISIARECLQ